MVTAVAVSGVAGPHWTFEGFLPRSGRERRERLARIAADERGAIVFEAPNRVAGTLRDLADACGPDRPAAVCRELTKLHETVSRGTLGELAEAAGNGAIPARGEFVLVVGSLDLAPVRGQRSRQRGGHGRCPCGGGATRRGRPGAVGCGATRGGGDRPAATRPVRGVARLNAGPCRWPLRCAGDRLCPNRRPAHPRTVSTAARIFLLGTVVVSFVAIVLDFVVCVGDTALFVVAAIGILGLAWTVGLSTERLGSLTGPQVGGILNATFGNIAELIIAFFALQAGLIEVVKASLTGSIIGNLLLVLGASVLVGGLRHGTQTFSRQIASSNAALLVVALVGLFVPAVFAFTSGSGQGTVTEESVLVSVALIIGYGLSLAYSFTQPERRRSAAMASRRDTPGLPGRPAARSPCWSHRRRLLAVLSEILVGSIEGFIEQFGLSEFFVGVVLIPTIGNLAEHLVAVQLAFKNKMEFAMAVAYGSSLQVALFVAPILVLIGVVIGQPMDLVFTPLEVAAVAAAVGISALIALDGESNWLEGALLIIVYAILAVSFFEFQQPV